MEASIYVRRKGECEGAVGRRVDKKIRTCVQTIAQMMALRRHPKREANGFSTGVWIEQCEKMYQKLAKETGEEQSEGTNDIYDDAKPYHTDIFVGTTRYPERRVFR